MHGVYLGGVFWAIHHGLPAGLSALIVGLQPLITAVLAGSLLGERILPRHWAGLAAGFAGVVIVLAPKLGAIDGGVTWATLAASFVAVAGMSAGTIWQKRFLTGSDLVTGTCWQYAGGALVMILLLVRLRDAPIHAQRRTRLRHGLAGAGAFDRRHRAFDGDDPRRRDVESRLAVLSGAGGDGADRLGAVRRGTLAVQIGGMALATFGVALATARNPAPGTAA